ncbi:winged helix-turn-helix transcriptional regulator [Streptomyces sp. NPDC001663]|uniref:winged helix-turn-helix transcriptional regulator n=1 Tax=Streptomyces sp. NPDC001663 TaxID=3364597 RepID=UPI0036B4B8E7
MQDPPDDGARRRNRFSQWPGLLRRRAHVRQRQDYQQQPGWTVAQQSRYALRILRREWVTDVLEVLSAGPSQYGVLLQAIRDRTANPQQPSERRYIQDSVLNRTLSKLREEGLVLRDREETFPYHTTYLITEAGRQLLNALGPLASWSIRHKRL